MKSLGAAQCHREARKQVQPLGGQRVLGGRRCVHACAWVPARLRLTSPGSWIEAGVSPSDCHLQLGQQVYSGDVFYLVALNRPSKCSCCLILKESSRFLSGSLFLFSSAACPPPHTCLQHMKHWCFCAHTHTHGFPCWRKADDPEIETSVYAQGKQQACRFLQSSPL